MTDTNYRRVQFGKINPRDPNALSMVIRLLTDFEIMTDGLLNGGMNLVENMDVSSVSFTTGTAGSESVIAHTLGKVPNRWIITSKDKSADIYPTATAFNASNVFFQSDTNTVTATALLWRED